MADHLMEYWAWTICALFMHIVKYERKKPPFAYHCKLACAMIIDNMNHYSKCLHMYIPCWSRPTEQNIALSGIRMHTICLIKCIYLCRLYVIIRRHSGETPSTYLALREGNHLRPMASHHNRPLWRNFGGLSWKTFENKTVRFWFEGNDLRRHDAPWRHWNL